ncbi:SDR family NAD(P)-dependent oxidoreductase [Roseobacter sp.]|uniref:SDR family NAD(P)-dependent oxidoreductase n=1 Tax=Roseobacter sp. TaxID=1907202 RepID=UPI0038596CA9
MELMGKRALVTGAGSDGIGRAVVRALADAGARVAIHHLGQADSATALAEEVAAPDVRHCVLEGDFGDPDQARRVVRVACTAMGGLDIVVHCAATLARVPFLEIDDAEWDRVHAVNLRGAFAIGQESARAMVNNPDGGRIIFVSSVNQDNPTMHLVHYVSSKGGVRMLARSMAMELAEHGVTVNLIAPGTVETDLNRIALADTAFRQSKLDMIPMKRIATPAEVAGAALYFAGPTAGYVTGTTITVDGGLTL